MHRITYLLIGTALATHAPAAEPIELFNGKDLTGWGYKADSGFEAFDGKSTASDGRYTAKDGVLVVNPGKGIKQLWTKASISTDFELRLEFRASVNADSGLFVRGPQLQVRDYLVAGPFKDLKKYKPQDWNEIVVVVKGTVARCTCNGEVLQAAMKVPEAGPIGLEADRGQMEYRNLRLTPARSSPQKGERVVFLGDSITQAGVGPKGYVTLINTALAKTEPGYEVIGAGISGNKVPDLQRRLEKDVLTKKPTRVVVYIGINDVWHGEKDPSRGTPKDKFESGLTDIVHKIQKSGARVIVCTPTVIGEKKAGSNPLDAKLDEYAAVSRSVAKETGATLCDLRAAFLDYLSKHNPSDQDRGILTTDRVHLNDAGNRLVAKTILAVIKP